jgi:hypothetical protein
MQGDACNAVNEFLRRPLFEELSTSPVLRPLLCVNTMLHCRPFTLYVYESSNAHGPAMRIPSTHGVHQGCFLGAMFPTIIASRAYNLLAAIAPNESVVCASRAYKQLAAIAANESVVYGYSCDGPFLGPPCVSRGN